MRVGFERKFWWNRNICPKIVTYAGLTWGGESHSGYVVQNMSNIKISYTYQMDCEKHNKLYNN